MVVPSNATGTYWLSEYADSSLGAEAEAARFLIQTTYGPTRSTIESLANLAYKSWVEEQMAMPYTLQRAYWRKHTSPRPLPAGSSLGGVRSPCNPGSRWHGWAFGPEDVGRDIDLRRINGTADIVSAPPSRAPHTRHLSGPCRRVLTAAHPMLRCLAGAVGVNRQRRAVRHRRVAPAGRRPARAS